jgi:hypothetical protein
VELAADDRVAGVRGVAVVRFQRDVDHGVLVDVDLGRDGEFAAPSSRPRLTIADASGVRSHTS